MTAFWWVILIALAPGLIIAFFSGLLIILAFITQAVGELRDEYRSRRRKR